MIRQFDVVANPSASSRAFVRYAVVLSSHHLEGVGSVILAPLTTDPAISRVDVEVTFEGDTLTLAIAELQSVDVRLVRRSLGSLVGYEQEIRRAIERVFSGF